MSKNKNSRSASPGHTPQPHREYPCCQHCGGRLDFFPSPQGSYTRDCSWGEIHTIPCPKCQVGNVGEAYIDPDVQYVESGPWTPGLRQPSAWEAGIKKKIADRTWQFGGLRMWAADLSTLVSTGASPEKTEEAIEALIALDASAEKAAQKGDKVGKDLPRPEEQLHDCCEHCTLSEVMGPCGGLHPVQCDLCARASRTTDGDGIALLISNRTWVVGAFLKSAEDILAIGTGLKIPLDKVKAAVVAIIAADEAAGRSREAERRKCELEAIDWNIEQLRTNLRNLKDTRKALKRWLKENR